jgi:hypothetical protein
MSIDMPSTPGFTDCKFGLVTNTQKFQSPLTNNVQRVLLGGALWNATYSLPAMKRDKAAAWKAFFLLLEGGANTFNAFDPDCKTPRGVATGSPYVYGPGQSGSVLQTNGWTPGVIGILRVGDYFAVNGELKMVTADATSFGGGNAAVNFKPALRNSPADNAPITLQRASCAMALADDMQAMWECDNLGIYQPRTFTAMEVF